MSSQILDRQISPHRRHTAGPLALDSSGRLASHGRKEVVEYEENEAFLGSTAFFLYRYTSIEAAAPDLSEHLPIRCGISDSRRFVAAGRSRPRHQNFVVNLASSLLVVLLAAGLDELRANVLPLTLFHEPPLALSIFISPRPSQGW